MKYLYKTLSVLLLPVALPAYIIYKFYEALPLISKNASFFRDNLLKELSIMVSNIYKNITDFWNKLKG
jgi:hypothetical protein